MDAESEDRGLFEAYQKEPNEKNQEAIVSRYSRLVVGVAKSFRGRWDWEDLLQIGYLGLIKAIQGFRLEKGNRFSTYATHCIQGEIRHYLRDRNEVVRRPRWLQGLSKKVGVFVEKFLQRNERLPSIAEVSEGCNLSPDGVLEVLKAGQVLSLEQLQGEAGIQVSRIRSLREESFVLRLEDRVWLESALEGLLAVERQVIDLFFFRDLNQAQISGATGLPPKRVSRVMRKALERLRDLLRLGPE